MLVSQTFQTSNGSGEEEKEAPVPEPFEYYSNDDKESKAGSLASNLWLSEFQLAIEQSLHPANTSWNITLMITKRLKLVASP